MVPSLHPHRFNCRQFFSAGLLAIAAITSQPLLAISMDQAVNKVQSEQGGKVLGIEQVSVKNNKAYRIKLLQPSGHVRVLLIDAKTGKQLK